MTQFRPNTVQIPVGSAAKFAKGGDPEAFRPIVLACLKRFRSAYPNDDEGNSSEGGPVQPSPSPPPQTPPPSTADVSDDGGGDDIRVWFVDKATRRIDAEEAVTDEWAATIIASANNDRQLLEDMIEFAADFHDDYQSIKKLGPFLNNQLKRFSPEHIQQEAEKIREKKVRSGTAMSQAEALYHEQMAAEPVNTEPVMSGV